MVDNVVDALELLRPVVRDLDPRTLDGETAVNLVGLAVEVEQLGMALRVQAARAVERTDHAQREGYRSAAAWMAAQAGMPVGPALRTMEMAAQLDGLPLVDEAFRAGRLSEAQAREIVDAAGEVPDAQQQLLDFAAKLTLRGLREECQRVKASVLTDADERQRRIHKGRYLRAWMDPDGAVRLSARLAADEGTWLLAEIDARRDDLVRAALRGRWYENPEAHRADALVDLARTGRGGDPDGPRAMVHVMVDYDALMRGHPVTGEKCEVPGLGPIPVALARQLATDCILKVLVTKGVDITAVAHGGRTLPAHLRSALDARDEKCVVPYCDVRHRLQYDHRVPWSVTGESTLDGMARLCPWHHYQKTYLGYTYRGGPGTWEWIPPDRAIGEPIPP